MRFWGARYSRTWFTTLAALPLLSGIFFSVLGGTRAWIVLLPLTVLVVGLIWLVPQAVVGDAGVRLVLRGRLVRWSDIETVLDPGPGDEDLRVEVAGRRVLRLDGVPPSAAADIRALHAAHRDGR
jgi:hypothetical protein